MYNFLQAIHIYPLDKVVGLYEALPKSEKEKNDLLKIVE